jgi:osmoprotectant transport system substrate-binding protein
VLHAALAVLLLVLAGCSGAAPATAPAPSGAIRLASYDFPENQILVDVYAEALRRAGLPVTVQHGVGTRELVEPALEQGVVDVVIDYLGTALTFVRHGEPGGAGTPEELHAALAAALGERGVSVLAASAAEDQNGFAVTTAFAARHRITRLSELAPIAGQLTFGGPPECPQRPFCLLGLRSVYGLDFGRVVSMPSRPATVEALMSGQIDVGLLETTDARRFSAPVILLIDDRSLQPHENVVPLVRTAVLQRWGDPARQALDATSSRLTDQELVALNRAVEVDGLTPAQAARQWWDRQER